MAILKKNAFSRGVPDLVTEELVAVLSRRASFEFKQLFDIVHENLRARNATSGGEERLRLRAYEKLQNLVARGAVKKNGKKYKGLPAALAAAIAPQNGHLAGVKSAVSGPTRFANAARLFADSAANYCCRFICCFCTALQHPCRQTRKTDPSERHGVRMRDDSAGRTAAALQR